MGLFAFNRARRVRAEAEAAADAEDLAKLLGGPAASPPPSVAAKPDPAPRPTQKAPSKPAE